MKFRSQEECGNCRSRQELPNAYLVAKIGADTAENELKKCVKKNALSSQNSEFFQKLLTIFCFAPKQL